MIVAAALVWWNERPDDLEACIRGVATVADRIVAVDGAYARYPGATVLSAPEQARRIMETAVEVGIGCEVHAPGRLWAGQVEKRTHAMQRASCGADWVMVVDADWIVSGDREQVRAELAQCAEDVVAVPFRTRKGDRYATKWHRAEEDRPTLLPQFYRPLPGLRVESHHWWYSAVKDGRRVWMWHGEPTPWPVLPQHALRAPYGVEHLTLLRSEQQVLDSRAFCNDRARVVAWTGQEDDVPGLPRPEYDYVTEPIG